MVLKENNTNWDFRCGVWEMIWNTWLRLSSGMARWVEFETNFWQILWLMFQVAEAGVLAWGDLITLGRLDDLENQIIVLCLQELGWCNSRGEISSTGMFILYRQKIFSMKYKVVFIYPCRPQTSPACWFTLPGPLVSPREWWCHRFLSNFHSETLVEWRFFHAPLQDNITWTVRAAQETYDWNWDSEEVEQLCFNSRRKRKWKWIGPISTKKVFQASRPWKWFFSPREWPTCLSAM